MSWRAGDAAATPRAGWVSALWRAAVACSPPLLAGLLVAASLPPERWWPLAPLGVALLSRCVAGAPWRRRLRDGFLAGIGQFALGCLWSAQFTAAGYVALVVVESVFVALACALSPPRKGRLPALAGLLTLAEWARQTWPLGGLPLGGVALGQVSGPFIDVARLGGPLLVVGAVCLAGTGLERCASASVGRWQSRGDRARGHAELRSLAGGTFALLLVAGVGLAAAHAPDGGGARRRIDVVAVQGGGQRGLSALQVSAATVLGAQIAATRDVGRGTELVVWPEDSVSLAEPLARSGAEPLLAATARRLATTLVAGITEPDGAGRFLNEAAVWAPSGRYVSAYVKVHPVPFGEYVPFRSLLEHVVSLAAVPRDAVAGHRSGMVATPAGRLALLLSYETFFSGLGRSGVRAGGELVVVPTNTASYASTQVPAQELAASRLQAVGEGRDLVQVASTGYSAIVNNRGRVVKQSSLGARDVLRASVSLRTGLTIFDRFGDLPALVAGLAGAAGGWLLAAAGGSSWRWRSRGRASRRALC